MGHIELSSGPIYQDVTSKEEDVVAIDAIAMAENLVWKDTYYEHEPDIVAVFDFNPEAIEEVQRKSNGYALCAGFFLLCALCALGMLMDGVVYYMDSSLGIFLVIIFILVIIIFFILSAASAGEVPLSTMQGRGHHLAITSVSVRYDQEDPMVSTEVSQRFAGILWLECFLRLTFHRNT